MEQLLLLITREIANATASATEGIIGSACAISSAGNSAKVRAKAVNH